MTKIRVALISDTHLVHEDSGVPEIKIPDADILIHTGDAAITGTFDEIARFCAWFRPLPHRHKIFVPGNHDTPFAKDRDKAVALLPGVHYLEGDLTVIEGLRIWGGPWQPAYDDSAAFALPRGTALRQKWDKIPERVDIVATHCPPHGILDKIQNGTSVGCADLRDVVLRREPILHTFGHIHPAGGQARRLGKTLFVNAALMNVALTYDDRQPILVEIDTEERIAKVLSGIR